MRRIIRGIHSTTDRALILFVFALTFVLTLPVNTSVAVDSQESGGVEHRNRQSIVTSGPGLRGHGFARINGAFTTINAPNATSFTLAFGIDDNNTPVGSYVDGEGTLHGFLPKQGKFTVINFPGAKATFVARMNARGQIVGSYGEDPNTPALSLPHGFLLHNGVFTPIDFPGAQQTRPFGINNLGQIVGEYVDTSGVSHGFLRDQQGVFITRDAPYGTSTILTDINDNGQIVGLSFTGAIVTGLGPAFLRNSDGTFTKIAFPDAIRTVAWGINNLGQIVGDYEERTRAAAHGFLLNHEGYTTIDAPDAIGSTTVYDINDEGNLVGTYDLLAHGYLQDSSGDFETIDHPMAVRYTGELIGINNLGQIVGIYLDGDGMDHGFLLDDGVFTPISVPDSQVTIPFRINDQGRIVGHFNDTRGTHGFLLADGEFNDIDYPGILGATLALDINNSGQIVGQYTDNEEMVHGFLRDSSGDFISIDAEFPDAITTTIYGINDSGQMIGAYANNMGFQTFLRDQTGYKKIAFPGAVATQATGINNLGQIVGNYIGAGGRRYGFLRLSDGSYRTLPAPPGTFIDFLAQDLDDQGRIVGIYY
jgi:probable HAF family extracellular repeat protein